jgi:hypothetical protein
MSDHPRTSGAGFVRLGDMLPLIVTLRHGRATCTLPANLLERLIGVPNLGAALFRLVDPQFVHEERGKGGEKSVSLPGTSGNGFQKYLSEPFSLKRVRGTRGEEENAAPVSNGDNSERLARHIAATLHDERSIAWYRLVARRVDHEVIREALTRALDVPARDLRRSRGAVFTALMRPHLKQQ